LDAPYVRVIGLFSNSLEDPGLISSQGGHWAGVPDFQLDFLTAQLKRIKQEKYSGAVLLATHHPPFSYSPPPNMGGGGNHSSSSAMLRDIDEICKREGVHPHAFLAAHAHNYQRYTRIVEFAGKDLDVPFIVCGDGGHNVNPLLRGKKGQGPHERHMASDLDYLDFHPVLKATQHLLYSNA